MIRRVLLVACFILAGCQPGDLERRSTADVKSLADCIFSKVPNKGRWVREDAYQDGHAVLRVESDEIQTIVVEASSASGSRVTAKFPIKATAADREVLEEVFDACGARSAI